VRGVGGAGCVWGVRGLGSVWCVGCVGCVGGVWGVGVVGSLLTFNIPQTALVVTLDTYDFQFLILATSV
jgi:hypothetical protein